MSTVRKPFSFIVLALVLGLLLTACRPPDSADVPLTFQPTEPATETPFVPTPLPPDPKTLIVCLADEPASLFIYHPDVLYGEASAEAHTVLQAIYDGPVDLRGYEVQPVLLEDLPTLENGGVTLQPVTIGENEVFFNPITLQPENLRIGDRYLPQGCQAPDCLATYTGGDVQMDQMIVEFTIREGVEWSDGQPLTASDSYFSYKLDRHGELPTTKFLVDRTADYDVMDGRRVRWVGIPGYMDSDYKTNFWSPLPEHMFDGIQPGELVDVETINRAPLGWGPYVIEAWEPGSIRLIPNDRYQSDRAGEPAFERLTFRFLDQGGDGALQQILTDECDIVDESLLGRIDLPSAQDLEAEGRVKLWSAPDSEIVRLDFNLAPLDPSHPAFFQDLRTRQAVSYCIDRSKLQSAVGYTSAGLPTTYINNEHPDHISADVPLPAFDPVAGEALLEQIGWVLDEDNPESPRVAFGVPGVRMATPFAISLLAADTDEILEAAALVEADLEACGLAVEVRGVPTGELGAPWPEGPVFGRAFDLVIWSWPEWVSPLCEMFAGWEIPGSAQPYGVNATGYRSDAYDAACKRLFLTVPGMVGYQEAVAETQQIFNQDLPALPLFQGERWVAADREVCGLAPDGLVTSMLWNLEVLDSGDSCP
ncbi:MAG: ABC transporter substrate-binding protein [Anaerolineales bacterium]|nr:ABC transporter substrate-binding protein [Anaerolineales bacterium]